MSLAIKLRVTHTNSLRKLRQTQRIVIKHKNVTIQTFPKHNGWSMCDCDQKVSFYSNKGVMTMKCTKDVLINATTLENTQEHLKHIRWHETTLDDQSDTWHDDKVGSKIWM